MCFLAFVLAQLFWLVSPRTDNRFRLQERAEVARISKENPSPAASAALEHELARFRDHREATLRNAIALFLILDALCFALLWKDRREFPKVNPTAMPN